MDEIPNIIGRIDPERIRRDLFHLSQTPLPFRTANRTLPGHDKSTLDEADEFLMDRLRGLGYSPWKEAVEAQAFGFDATKPRRRAYATPKPDAPWYKLHNIYVQKTGREHPKEIILLLAHKDSQSWFESPGAYDDGSFIKAGFPAAIANLGSFPYEDPNYHDLGDTPDKVDIANAHLAARAILAAVLMTDRDGAA